MECNLSAAGERQIKRVVEELAEVRSTSIGQFGRVDAKTGSARSDRVEDNVRSGRTRRVSGFGAVSRSELDLGNEVERGSHRKEIVLVGEDKKK